ncbi:MAG: small multi-drug export protein, partial [Planctomycetota bacterium]|nr:small multi-drug export protein [Planctomycetota bacterium]
ISVFAATLGSIAWLYRTQGTAGLTGLGSLTLTSLVALGKFVIFAGLRGETSLGPWALALMVWLIDLLVAFLLASGLESLERAPVLGRWLRRARRRAMDVLTEYPRFERMAFLGVALFVLMPIASTGAVTGSFAARIMGLSRLAGVVAIALGSAGTAVLFAMIAQFLGERGEVLLASPVLIGVCLVAFVVFLRIAYVKVRTALRKA